MSGGLGSNTTEMNSEQLNFKAERARHIPKLRKSSHNLFSLPFIGNTKTSTYEDPAIVSTIQIQHMMVNLLLGCIQKLVFAR